jgi:hypothetical protein
MIFQWPSALWVTGSSHYLHRTHTSSVVYYKYNYGYYAHSIIWHYKVTLYCDGLYNYKKLFTLRVGATSYTTKNSRFIQCFWWQNSNQGTVVFFLPQSVAHTMRVTKTSSHMWNRACNVLPQLYTEMPKHNRKCYSQTVLNVQTAVQVEFTDDHLIIF